MIAAVFPDLSLDWWERACFLLGWRQCDATGLGRSYSDLLRMPLDHIQRDLERVAERRQLEAEYLRAKARS